MKERINHPTTLGENQMAQVTYRGVKYDTNSAKGSDQKQQETLTYRGQKYAVGVKN